MFDVSWGELLIVAGVALVVIGPKDLPGALRSLGQITAKMRRMAGEFQNQFNEAMREADLDAIRKDVASVGDAAQNLNPLKTIRDEIKGAIDARPPEANGASSSVGSAPTTPTRGAGGAAAAAGAANSGDGQREVAAMPPVPDAGGVTADASAAVETTVAIPADLARETTHAEPPGEVRERKPDAA